MPCRSVHRTAACAVAAFDISGTKSYYQELELGQLEPGGVATKVWDALSGLLGRDVRGLAALPLQAPAAAPMFREANVVDHDLPLEVFSQRSAPELDEVDRLFGVDAEH